MTRPRRARVVVQRRTRGRPAGGANGGHLQPPPALTGLLDSIERPAGELGNNLAGVQRVDQHPAGVPQVQPANAGFINHLPPPRQRSPAAARLLLLAGFSTHQLSLIG